jgi:hypothetical protein
LAVFKGTSTSHFSVQRQSVSVSRCVCESTTPVQ